MRRAVLVLVTLMAGCAEPKAESADPCEVNDSMAVLAPSAPLDDSMPGPDGPNEAVPMPNACADTADALNPPA